MGRANILSEKRRRCDTKEDCYSIELSKRTLDPGYAQLAGLALHDVQARRFGR